MLMQCPSELKFLPYSLGSFFRFKKIFLGLSVPELNVSTQIIERGRRSKEGIRFMRIRSKILTW